MEKENVIQKIQKLLKLQYGAEQIGSTGEAFQAAKMVQKLLMEYNLSMSDIDTDEETQEVKMTHTEDISSGDKYGNHWKYNLLSVIADNNLCTAYKRVSGKMFIVGAEDNTVIVTEFYKYLVKVFRRLAKKHLEEKINEWWVERGLHPDLIDESIKVKYIRSYLEGVPFGLQENYDSLKPTSKETALVVCHKEMIDDYVNEQFKFSDTKHRHRKRKIYGDAYKLGVADGRNVSLNKQIT